MATGRIFDVQRFSIHDGPGIRTTFFFKGCPLRCLWCGNPESIGTEPILSYVPEKCIGCGACVPVCPEDALSLPAGARAKAVLDRQRCTGCGQCDPTCDARALEIVGREATVEELLEVVLRDADYYEASGGGLTLSGGEPLLQPRFAESLLRQAKARGLHCTVETSGYTLWGAMRGLVPLVDLWLYDFKETDSRLHERFTGKPNDLILDNLQKLHDGSAAILLRCPMIPGHNARREHLDGIAALYARLPKLRGVEILPYYDLWRAKLERFGLTTTLPESVKPPSRETVASWKSHLLRRGVRVVE